MVVFSLWLSFRTKRGVLLPLTAVLIALVWTIGVLVLSGRAITLGTFVLPPLLLVVGTSYAIHVMARYYEQSEEVHRADPGRRARLCARLAPALHLRAGHGRSASAR